jgi:hypothetical protein
MTVGDESARAVLLAGLRSRLSLVASPIVPSRSHRVGGPTPVTDFLYAVKRFNNG